MRRFFQATLLDMENACPLKFTACNPDPVEGPDSTGALIHQAFELAKEELHRASGAGLDQNQFAYAHFSLFVQVQQT
jgi:hypothetical protein